MRNRPAFRCARGRTPGLRRYGPCHWKRSRNLPSAPAPWRGSVIDPGPSAIADGLELPVPIGGGGKPKLHFDVGVGGWAENHCRAAVGRQHERRCGRRSTSPATPDQRVRPRAGAPPRPGARKGPAGTASTLVKVTLGRLSDLRFSQGVCPNAAHRAPENVKARIVRIKRKPR